MKIAILGARGFIGRSVVKQLSQNRHEVLEMLAAPRLQTSARSLHSALRDVPSAVAELRAAWASLPRFDQVINCAGLAAPSHRTNDTLAGANGLLPGVLAAVGGSLGWKRLVHVSSAAVFGAARVLDETVQPVPDSPYGHSKLLGEQTATAAATLPVVVYRPTSVQDPKRPVTQSLARLAHSPFASVAGPGDQPVPVSLAKNIAAAIAYLVDEDAPPAHAVVHPWEGVTVAGLLRGLSGREPLHIPESAARAALGAGDIAGDLWPPMRAITKRIGLAWLGQEQAPGWFNDTTYSPPVAWDAQTYLWLGTPPVQRLGRDSYEIDSHNQSAYQQLRRRRSRDRGR